MFFVVINHFQRGEADPHLAQSAIFSASLSIRDPLVSAVVIVDGSGAPNEKLARQAAEIGVKYHHAGRSLSFAEGYNAGLSLSDCEWTVLCASDVYPSFSVFRSAYDCCVINKQTVGCVVPRLTVSALPVQESRFRQKRPIKIPLMTLNMNFFATEFLREIGGVPEDFSGYYNDVVMVQKIVRKGKSIWLLPDTCAHYGSLTVSGDGTSLKRQEDVERFRTFFPDLYDEKGFWRLRLRGRDVHPLLRVLNDVSRILPYRYRSRLIGWGMSLFARMSL